LLRERAGGIGKVRVYWDEPGTHSIAVFEGSLGDAHVAASIGLMDVELPSPSGRPVHTEILMERAGSSESIGNIVATLAFYVLKDGWKPAPGVVFEQMVAMFEPATSLPHVMFVPIFRWNDFARVDLDGKLIYPLLAVPISERESAYIDTHGGQALEDLWERHGTDVNDWSRASAA
jgi:hypothetical protein